MFSFDETSAVLRVEQRKEVIRILRNTNPDDLMAVAEHAALAAFVRARDTVPAYATLLSEAWAGGRRDISDMAAFSRDVPIIDKHQTFGRFTVKELCSGGSLDGVRSVLTSSGHSGVFSFGVNSEDNLRNSAHAIDLGLQYMFDVDNRHTLLINALPMGVKVHTTATTLAETSVRDDMVHAVIAAYGIEFEQIILIGEGSFVKKIIEDGAEAGTDWSRLPLSIITGEEGIAENYRTYMAHLLGIERFDNSASKRIVSSMGVAELDLNIFHETGDTVEIRRLAHADAKLRARLFGAEARYCPMFFVYYPHRCLVESINGELVMSMLSEQMRIPLIRYRTGDMGRPYSHDEVVSALRDCGYSLTPDLKLPFVAVWGRDRTIAGAQGTLTASAVKEALYVESDIACALTGNFLISAGEAAPTVDLHLKPGHTAPAAAAERLAEALRPYSDAAPQFRFHPYASFPSGMVLDYERKFPYIRR